MLDRSAYFVLFLTATAASYLVETDVPTIKPRGNLTEFLNGVVTNITHILEDIEDANETLQVQEADQVFAAADSAIRTDTREMNFRSIFSRSRGNEFINSRDVAAAAITGVNQLARLVASVGLNTTNSFDADGNPIDPGVMAVSQMRPMTCPFDLPNRMPCNNTFREPTGRCTNRMVGKRTWGMAGTPYSRVLPASYEDGVGAPQKTALGSGESLKSAREISTVVTTTRVVLNNLGFDANIMQWGQYISHEFTHLAETEADAACCPDQILAARNEPGTVPTTEELDEIREEIKQERGDVCIQIEVEDDPRHGGYVCMTQTRSRPAPPHDCSIAPRQQMNSITHVFDGSVVYGSSQAEQDALRSFEGGQLLTQTVNGRVLPPQDLENCPAADLTAQRCPFRGGDTRINTTPNLMSMHAVAIVHHNKLANRLGLINPHWSDERIFQETRRIVSAVEANIHYYEYLPLIIGDDIIRKYKLESYAGFRPEVNPSVLSELAHGAMRFGHSTVGGIFGLVEDSDVDTFAFLQPHFFNTSLLYNGGYSQCIRGLLGDRPWVIDRNFPDAIRNFLFDSKRDLIALNINRGRDHGLQSYTSYRKFYNLSVPTSFDNLSATHSEDVIKALRLVYTSVDDLELYPAGVTENHVPGGLTGELFANIMGDGFSRLLQGDMLWFEGRQSGLTSAQIAEIKKYRLHNLLCHGADLDTVNNHAFFRAGQRPGDSEISCSSVEQLNLTLWRDEPPLTEPECHWQEVSRSPCCFGSRTVYRECVGDDGCVCPGNEEEEEILCTCVGTECSGSLLAFCSEKWLSALHL